MNVNIPPHPTPQSYSGLRSSRSLDKPMYTYNSTYPPVIKRGNGKSLIYRYFPSYTPLFSSGFSSQPRLRTGGCTYHKSQPWLPDGISKNHPISIPWKLKKTPLGAVLGTKTHHLEPSLSTVQWIQPPLQLAAAGQCWAASGLMIFKVHHFLWDKSCGKF